MQRKLQLLLLLLLVAGTTETGMRASTDCERWMAAYKAQLAHTKAARRIQIAHERVKKVAQRKLANYVQKPASPKVVPVHAVRPKYTRQQMLDRFNIACGDLPADTLVEANKTPAGFPAEMVSYEPVAPVGSDDGGLIPSGDVPPYTPPAIGGGNGPGGGAILPPIYGGGGGGGGSTGGGGGTNPPPPTPPPPPPPQVPEPGTLVLMLTGAAGAAGAIRRRMRS